MQTEVPIEPAIDALLDRYDDVPSGLDLSEGYPYLAIARLHGVPYGLVLTYADGLERFIKDPLTSEQATDFERRAIDELPENVRNMIVRTIQAENDRREKVLAPDPDEIPF